MSKELKKFQASYKKAKALCKDITSKEAAAALRRVKLTWANVSAGETNLEDSVVSARDNGVTGTSLGDFMKDKSFQEGMKLLNVAIGDMDKEVEDLKGFCDRAATASDALAVLHGEIEKDLKKRKDKSESKSDIESLKSDIEADYKVVNPLIKTKDQLLPVCLTYGKDLPKTVNKILKDAPAVQAEAKDSRLAPHQVTDRLLKRNLTLCLKASNTVNDLCESAIDKAGKGDASGTQADLKSAVAERKKVSDLSAEYQKILKDHKAAIDNSKDKNAILTAIAKMAKMDTDSERKLRGVATTIRKAGA